MCRSAPTHLIFDLSNEMEQEHPPPPLPLLVPCPLSDSGQLIHLMYCNWQCMRNTLNKLVPKENYNGVV